MSEVEVGNKVPDFSLPASGGGTFALSGLKKKSLVIYFYPKDNTPGCTKEVCSFRDSFEEFTERGAMVIGISADSELFDPVRLTRRNRLIVSPFVRN